MNGGNTGQEKKAGNFEAHFLFRLLELLLRAEMLVDAICRTAIDYLYPTIAPDPAFSLPRQYLTNLERIACGFPGHLDLVVVLVRDSFS